MNFALELKNMPGGGKGMFCLGLGYSKCQSPKTGKCLISFATDCGGSEWVSE